MSYSTSQPSKSLLSVISSTVIITVAFAFFVDIVFSYQLQKNLLVDEIKGQARESAERLSTIVIPFIDSYAINEYEKLVRTEVNTTNHYAVYAIVVENKRMAEILGEHSYLSGSIKGNDFPIRDIDLSTTSDQELLKKAFYSHTLDLTNERSNDLGSITVYVSDASMAEHLNALIIRSTLTTFLIVTFLAVFLIYIIKRLLITPLKQISKGIANRDKDGLPQTIIEQSEFSEINILTNTVNEMVNIIGETRDKLRREHTKLSNVIKGTRAGTWYWNIQTGETELNERWAEIIGRTLQELEPNHIDTWIDYIHPNDVSNLRTELIKHFKGKTDFYHCEARMKHKQGHWVWILIRGKVATWTKDGKALEMYGTHQDISVRKNSERQLILAANVYKQVHEGIIVADKNGIIVDVNTAFTDITGYSRDEAIGKPVNLLKSGYHDKAFYVKLWQSLTENGHWSGEIWNKRKGGHVYPEWITISTVKYESEDDDLFVALFSDITSLKEREKQLQRIAHYDSLTNLPNRLLFQDRLRQAMSRANRYSKPLALLFLDLDGFKEVNDEHGHDIGDKLLVAISEKMSGLLRVEDTLARLGGDEFIIILPDTDNKEDLTFILTRLLDSIAEPIAVNNYTLSISASIGVTIFSKNDEVDADQLIRQADQAMYHAKLLGKNCFHFFDIEQDRHLRGVNEIVSQIQTALIENEFQLYFQPKVNLRSGEIVGFEALIRWLDPKQGMRPPNSFLPLVEHHPIMIEIGEWTIKQGLKHITEWANAGHQLNVSINIAAIHMQQSDFIEQVKNLLSLYPRVSPELLQFEVLETSALENVAQAQEVIKGFEKLGIDFALDDFGTGYSSLSYLKHLPAKIIKVDQSFVQHISVENDDRLILEAIIGLAKIFDKQVIAEGLEEMKYAELLVSMGCEIAQGYGIARPMPAVEVLNWIQHWQASHRAIELPSQTDSETFYP